MFEIGNLANHCFRTLLIDIGSRDDKSLLRFLYNVVES